MPRCAPGSLGPHTAMPRVSRPPAPVPCRGARAWSGRSLSRQLLATRQTRVQRCPQSGPALPALPASVSPAEPAAQAGSIRDPQPAPARRRSCCTSSLLQHLPHGDLSPRGLREITPWGAPLHTVWGSCWALPDTFARLIPRALPDPALRKGFLGTGLCCLTWSQAVAHTQELLVVSSALPGPTPSPRTLVWSIPLSV